MEKKKQFEHLFKPLQIGSVTIKNRFCVGPMGTNSPYGHNHEVTEQGKTYFTERAKGGFGLIFSGALMTDTEIDPFDPVEGLSPLKTPTTFRASAAVLNERLRAHGTKMFPQITMGLGRNYPGLYAPSELPVYFAPDMKSPALSNDQVKRKIELMVQAAALMQASEFDGVEVHAMHWGYLLDQFAMSITNQRTDEYGGTLENRMRCAKEIVEGIKQTCGSDFPVTMRLGVKSFMKGFNQPSLDGADEVGRTIEEGVKISKMLESYGYDALSVDVGVYDSFYQAAAPMYMPKGHVIDLYEQVKKEVNIPVLAGSRMNDPYISEQAIADGKIDAVVLARASLADPYYPKKLEMGEPEKIRPCIACDQACLQRALEQGLPSYCAVNPAATRELEYGISKATELKKVVVVGGGVSGMEFARTARLRGHEVDLYEKTNHLGGHLQSGGVHEFKKEVRELNAWYQNELKDLDVNVHMGAELTADRIRNMDADVVALSTGSVPVLPPVPGIDKANVCTSIEALLGQKEVGQKVVIVGGGLVGCEMALEMAMEGKDVTIVEMADNILSVGEPVPIMNGMMLRDLLAKYKVEIVTGNPLEAVTDKGAKVAGKEIPADTVVIAVGFKPVSSMAADLAEIGKEVYETGDGKKVGNVMWAIWEAYEIARTI